VTGLAISDWRLAFLQACSTANVEIDGWVDRLETATASAGGPPATSDTKPNRMPSPNSPLLLGAIFCRAVALLQPSSQKRFRPLPQLLYVNLKWVGWTYVYVMKRA
jgi:hypothetical protein